MLLFRVFSSPKQRVSQKNNYICTINFNFYILTLHFLVITRAYLEITNVCNLSCIFCPKNARPKRKMTVKEFDRLTDRLRGQVQFLYFHLMGEPMMHEHLGDFIRTAREKGFIPVLTTNGTLLQKPLSCWPHKIQISLHSQEANEPRSAQPTENQEQHEAHYIDEVMHFAQMAEAAGTIVVLRLWNQGGFDSRNETLLRHLERHIPQPWTKRYDGWRLSEKIYLEYDQMFEWPDDEHAEYAVEEQFCYALRNQIGIHVDGTVVPCCLDHDGSVPLGNLHQQTLDEILSSPRARALYDGFSHHTATEPFCRKCEYAAITKRFRKR